MSPLTTLRALPLLHSVGDPFSTHVTIIDWDIRLFYAINHLPHPGWADWLMGLFWSPKAWIPVILAACTWIMWKDRKKGWFFVALMLVSVGGIDRIIHRGLKPAVFRIRPCFSLTDVRTPMGLLNGQESYPSAHAANTMAAATAMYLWSPPLGLGCMALSLLTGFSRIYHGAHFPLDVLSGWLLGAWTALLVWLIAQGVLAQRRRPPSTTPSA